MGVTTGAYQSWQRGSAAIGDQSLKYQISTVILRALANVALERGVTPEQLLEGTPYSFAESASEQSVTVAEFQFLVARAAKLTKEPALGLLCGLHATDASFGLMAPLVAHASTLRAALEVIRQFQSLLIGGVRIKLTEHTGIARLSCDLNGLATDDCGLAELIVAGLVRMLRTFGCTRGELSAVCFTYARPAYYPSYSLAFGGVERFAQEFTGVEFAAHALDRPHLHHNAELHGVMLAQAKLSLERQSRPITCTERVRGLLTGCPASQLPDMEQAARELGFSVRSLRRRLEEEGTSYRELTQNMLYDLACTLLNDPSITLHGVAHALGFSDPTAFHRAFRRWSRRTPTEYRAASPSVAL